MSLRQVKVTLSRGKHNFVGGELKSKEPEIVNGVFHMLEQFTDKEISKANAIVELEDGKLYRFDIDDVEFTGKPAGANLFEDGLSESDITVESE